MKEPLLDEYLTAALSILDGV